MHGWHGRMHADAGHQAADSRTETELEEGLREITITDFNRAVLFQYEGAECVRCATSSNSKLWVFRVESEDAKCIEADFLNKETAIVLGEWLRAETRIKQLVQMAHKNVSGEWLAPTYSKRR